MKDFKHSSDNHLASEESEIHHATLKLSQVLHRCLYQKVHQLTHRRSNRALCLACYSVATNYNEREGRSRDLRFAPRAHLELLIRNGEVASSNDAWAILLEEGLIDLPDQSVTVARVPVLVPLQ